MWLCSHNCGILIDVKEGKIDNVKADDENIITKGYSCNKGYSIAHYVHHKQRVKYPLKKSKDGTFERISWDQAIKEIGQKLKTIKKEHTGQAVAIAGIGGQGNHLDGPYAVSFLKSLKSPWFFNALAQEKTQHPLVDKWMMNTPSISFLHGDIENTDFALVLGTNPLVSHRGMRPTEEFRHLANDDNRKMAVVDPRVTETAKRGDYHLQIKPGTDAALLLALIKIIIENNWYNKDFVDDKVVGFERLLDEVKYVDEKVLAKKCKLSLAEIKAVAKGFSQSPTACIFWDLGVEQVPYSTLIAYLIRVLLTLTDNLGKKGGNGFLTTFLPDFGPGNPKKKFFAAPVSGIEGIPILGNTGYFSPNLLPEEIMADHDQRIRALIVEGSNPMLQYADTNKLETALDSLDILVVIDPAMTETAQKADYVLPTPVGYEKWEWSMFPKGYPEIYAQLRPPVLEPLGEGLQEAEIYFRLAKTIGTVTEPPIALRLLAETISPRKLGAPFLGALMKAAELSKKPMNRLYWMYQLVGPHLEAKSLAAVWALCHMFVRTRLDDVKRSLNKKESRLNKFQIGELLFEKLMKNPRGVEMAKLNPDKNLEDNLMYADKKIRIAPEVMLSEIEKLLKDNFKPNPHFPFTLQAGHRTRWSANVIHRNPVWRKGRGPHCPVCISEEDAKKMNLMDGSMVRVESKSGEVELPLKIDKNLKTGHASIPNGFGTKYPDKNGNLTATGVNINLLTSASDRDPFTGVPYHKKVCVDIVPA